MTSNYDNKDAPNLRDLYPELNEQELEEARQNLRGYLAVMLRIHDRLERERDEDDLTSNVGDDAMEDERSDQIKS